MRNNFIESYLRNLVVASVKGDFVPFSNGTIQDVKGYIESILGRLRDNKNINIQADFNAYGSGLV